MGDRGMSAYCRYYDSQLGGHLPVYRGGQHGAGLGDILRSIMRWFAPVAVRGISSFATNMLDAHQRGAPIGDAAKGAIRPALGAMLSAAKAQTGGSASALFRGKEGVPYKLSDGPHRAVAYKRPRKKRGKHSVKKAKRRHVKQPEQQPDFNF